MSDRTLNLEDISAERFAPFGDLIDQRADCAVKMNEARFDRFTNLATVDVDGGCDAINISLMQCIIVSGLPYEISMLERHPHGSQAFMPISGDPYVVVVAPPDDAPDTSALKAFRVAGHQGINLRRGVWHLPMLGFTRHQSFFVVDKKGGGNCDEFPLSESITLTGSV